MRISDWSSDVCSSDLGVIAMLFIILGRLLARFLAALDQILAAAEVEHRHAELGKAEMVGPVIKALFGGRFVDHRALRRRRDLFQIGVEFGFAAADDDYVLGGPSGIQCVHRSEEHSSELQSLMRIS